MFGQVALVILAQHHTVYGFLCTPSYNLVLNLCVLYIEVEQCLFSQRK